MEIAMDIKISKEAQFQVLRETLEFLAPLQEEENWTHAQKANEQIVRREGDLFAAWIELGSCLYSLRMIHKSDEAFGAACFERGIDRTHQHRSAAMWLSQLEDDQLSTLREEFPEALHPKTLQDKCREAYPEWLTRKRKVCLPSGETSTSVEAKIEMVEKQPELPEELAKPMVKKVEKIVLRKKPNQNVTIAGRERDDEVWAIVSNMHQEYRVGISDLHPKEGWPMLLECMDLGLFDIESKGSKKSNGRVLFGLPLKRTSPAIAELSRYDLTKPSGCKVAQENLMPFLRKHAEALKADPESFMKLWVEESKSKRDEVIKADQEEKHTKLMTEISSRGEKEVIVCGVQIWPSKHTNFTSFSYEQLRLAWFMFLDAESIGGGNLWSKEGRKGRAILHRWLIKNYKRSFAVFKDKPGFEEVVQHADHVGLAWYELSVALQNGPDEKLQTSIPWTDITAV
jgi:hypothetical protein